MDIHAKRVGSPLYKIIMYLNKYEEDTLEDIKLQFLLKNLKTHFKKLFYMITYINKIQKDAEFIRKHDATSIVSISAIEYCYYKISTIWDIAYQIADKLIFPTKKNGNKYDYLENHFQQYAQEFPDLNLKWYKDFNKIRNKIVHGGITVNPYYVNDDNIKTKICFQAYDSDLNDLIQPHMMYSNRFNNNINFADYYFTFYTHLLYSYLFDFFDFVLLELNKDKSHDLNNLILDDIPHKLFGAHHETWLLSDVDQFMKITREMISLQIADGCLNKIEKIPSSDIEHFFNNFPFCLMTKVSSGDWVLVEDKAAETKSSDA